MNIEYSCFFIKYYDEEKIYKSIGYNNVRIYTVNYKLDKIQILKI